MTLEEVKQELKVFDKFTFFEEGHYYKCNNKNVGISVTRLIEEYSNPFDQQAIAEKVAIRDNKSVSEVLEEWEYKNKFACEKGSTCHEYAQGLWSLEDWNVKNFDSSIEYQCAVGKIIGQADNFHNDYEDRLEHLADEFVIGSEEYNIASAIDHLFINKLTGGLVLVDYKTNSDIYKDQNYYKNSRKKPPKMKVPLHSIDDFTINHYYIQLSIYKYLVEKYTDLKIEEMFIVYFSENIENYEIIEIPYLMKEVELILENRRERKMGKCIPVLIIGHSGSGKSASLRNLNKEDYSLVNPLAKRLPFKGGQAGLESCDYELIKKFIQETPKKIIVIDDSNYLLTIEMMKKAKETGYGKFTDIALNYWKLIEFIKNLDGDKRVYLMSHEEIDEFGNIGVKTVGKMLSNQCCVEGLYTVVLRAINENGKFQFRTKTAGNDIVKTPMGMFEDELIDNDLKLVDDTICEYYEINKEEEKKVEE